MELASLQSEGLRTRILRVCRGLGQMKVEGANRMEAFIQSVRAKGEIKGKQKIRFREFCINQTSKAVTGKRNPRILEKPGRI